jgi:hypothetical protein
MKDGGKGQQYHQHLFGAPLNQKSTVRFTAEQTPSRWEAEEDKRKKEKKKKEEKTRSFQRET